MTKPTMKSTKAKAGTPKAQAGSTAAKPKACKTMHKARTRGEGRNGRVWAQH